MTPLKQPERATPGKGGASMFGAALAVARETGPLGFFRGWLPAYMRDARLQRYGTLALWLHWLVEFIDHCKRQSKLTRWHVFLS